MVEVCLSYVDSHDRLNVYVMKGKTNWNFEQEVYSTTTAVGSGTLTVELNVEADCYLRALCVEVSDGRYRAYTTPIWFN